MPEFSVGTFVSELKREGFSKPYLFHLYIPNIDEVNGKLLKTFVKTASIPASTVNIINVPRQGRQVKLPGERVFGEWTFVVINDEKYKMRKIFEDWMNRISDVYVGDRSGQYPLTFSPVRSLIRQTNPLLPRPTGSDALLQDIVVQQLSPSGDVLATYKMFYAFPSALSQLDFNWESTSNTQDFTVTIAYQYYSRIDTEDALSKISIVPGQ